MSALREQIAAECRDRAERRHAAGMLSSVSLAELEIAQGRNPSSFSVIDREPCFRCGVRGDIGCSHRAPAQSSEVPLMPYGETGRLWTRATIQRKPRAGAGG